MKYLIPSLILLLFISACGTKLSEPVEKLFDETMVIHDEVMPEMSTINKAKKAHRKIIKNNDLTPELKTAHLQMIKELEDADDAMMDWMAEFSKPDADQSEKEALSYLENEKIKISKVRDKMWDAINKSKSMINE